MNTISPILLSDETLRQYCAILVAGNSKLKLCAKLAGMSQKKLRSLLFSADMKPDRIKEVSRKVVLALNQAMPDIREVRNIEESLFNGHVRMAWKLARKASRWGSLEYDDAEQEAFLGLVDAIYAYSKPGVKFNTFASTAVHRRLVVAHRSNNPLCPPTNEVAGLVADYEKAKDDLAKVGPVTTEKVICSMQVSESERNLLHDFLASTQVVQGNSIQDENEESLDYTAFRKGIDKERNAAMELCELSDLIDNADLTEIERKLVEASLNHSYHGWLTEMAANTINPATNKPYTKGGIKFLLDQATNKIRRAYESDQQYRMVG